MVLSIELVAPAGMRQIVPAGEEASWKSPALPPSVRRRCRRGPPSSALAAFTLRTPVSLSWNSMRLSAAEGLGSSISAESLSALALVCDASATWPSSSLMCVSYLASSALNSSEPRPWRSLLLACDALGRPLTLVGAAHASFRCHGYHRPCRSTFRLRRPTSTNRPLNLAQG